MTRRNADPLRRLVWDLPTRLFHWFFAISIGLSWLTAELGFSWMKWHLRLGYFALGLLVFRLAWGFIGPRHARFASFVRGPRAILRYLKQHALDVAPPGHNPLGALMVLFMLGLGLVQTGTGLFASDDIAWTGPYQPAVSEHTSALLTRIHHLNFNVLLAAIALHLIAIAYYRLARGHDLIGPMVRGWKAASRIPVEESIPHSASVRAVLLVLVVLGLVLGMLWLAPAPVATDGY